GLLRRIITAAIRAAGPVPVTVKIRTGIDDEHLTHLDAGRIAQDEGAAAVTLHARTAAQHYSGTADWNRIGELAATLDIPVLGNGDIWEATDALRMMRHTDCAGVVVGRGCLGRPWLFADLSAAFDGHPPHPQPRLGQVAAVMRQHATLLAAWMGEDRGIRDFRKHTAWYTKGFALGGDTRRRLGQISTLAELDDLLADLDADQPFPPATVGTPRGRTTGSPRRVALPDNWLADDNDRDLPVEAAVAVSGG
ncbi:MAG TPA: tRNA-dihydrouridine synthase, partial [Mycobacteriales bacterium]